MQKGLVSLISPCYNGEYYVSKLLESILMQTYPYIECIIVNDGSRDKTVEVIESFAERFRKKGYTLRLLQQKNSGQSAAVQNALQYVTGEFLVWPDSDDYYAVPDAIESLVNILGTSTDEFAMVRAQQWAIDADTGTRKFVIGLNGKEEEDRTLFEDCLLTHDNFWFCPGTHMIRTQALLDSTELPIYISKDAGQNWQLMLPVLYHYRCKTLMRPIYNVIQRSGSHSRQNFEYERLIKRINTYYHTELETIQRIKRMPLVERNKYELMLKDMYVHQFLFFSFCENRRAEFMRYYYELIEMNKISIVDWVRYIGIKYRYLWYISRFVSIVLSKHIKL